VSFAEIKMTKQIGRTIAGGIFFGILPLLLGWKFNIAGVSLSGPVAYVAAGLLGLCAALLIRLSIRRGVRE
jgi:uncharacterized membrane protein